MWILFSFLGATSDTVRDILQKRNTTKFNPVTSGFALNFYGTLILLPFILYFGIPELKPGYWGALIILAICGALWPIFYSYALKHDKLSNVAPLLALNPIVTTILVALVNQKLPSDLGWLGIVLVFFGLYLSRFDYQIFKSKGIIFPFMHLFSSLSSLSMLGVTICWSIGGMAAVKIVQTSSALFFIPSSVVSSALLSFFIVLFLEKSFFKNIFKLSKSILPFSAIHLVSELSVGMALSTGFLPYVASIKRSSIIGSTIAGVLVYKEKATILKIIGVVVTFIGVVMIILGR